MTNADLTLWFHEVLWPSYGELVRCPHPTKYRAGSKGESLKKVITLKPSAELQRRIVQAITEQRKHRRKLYEKSGSMGKYLEVTRYEKFYANRMCVTWLNQMGWEDEIPAIDEVVDHKRTMFGGARCQHDGCALAIHGPSYIYCTEHEARSDESNKALRAKLKQMQLTKSSDESSHDYAMRCKSVAMSILRGMGNGMRV